MNILITGTSRGIGFGLTSLALTKGHTVLAVARNTASLQKLKAEYAGKLELVETDISRPDGFAAIEKAVAKLGTLDLLINNAGMLSKGETADDLTQSFWINATVPFLLTKAMLPYLKKSKEPRVLQLSTKMGSIDDNSSGGYYAYRSSKTALNMLTRSLTHDHPEIRFALLHPGWVKTSMGGSDAPTEVTESIQGIWNVMEKMTPKNSGQFIDFQGKTIPW